MDRVEGLIKELKDKVRYVRYKAAEELGEKKDIRAVEPLIEALRDWDVDVREAAAWALGEIKDTRAVGPLIAALRDDDWWYVRSNAAEALEKIDPNWSKSEEAKRQVPEFIAVLKDKDENIRYYAAWILGKIGDIRAVEPLIATLRDEYWHVRRNAAWALGKIGDTRAVEPLIEALRDWSKDVRQTVDMALLNIQNQNRSLYKSHPYLLCNKCFLRSTIKRYPRPESFAEYSFIICRGCQSSFSLIDQIKQVNGVIGGNICGYQQDGDKVYVNLWEEANHQAINADIDILEIRGSSEITYDVAIEAVIKALKSDASRRGNFLKKVQIVIKGRPPIPSGIMKILKNEFKGITYTRL